MYEALFEVLKGFENADIAEFERITGNAISAMEEIGFSHAEARAYVYLFVAGYGTVELIASMAGLPRTSAYRIFRKLEKKGCVKAIGEEPRIYRVISPEIIASNIASRIAGDFEALEKYRISLEDGRLSAVQRIEQKDVGKKLSVLIDASERELLISTSQFGKFWKLGERAINHAIAKSLKIVLLTPKPVKLNGVNCIVDEKISTTEIVADRKAMIFTTNWKEFYFTTQPEFIAHLIGAWSGKI
ncbi:MAG: helix-turn-helix domain-containing protein [Thermoplasmata archaeon]